MTTTEGRRDRRKRQTRATLSMTALRMVAERGLDQVTVDEISEAAGVSPRTFFNYFACKDEAILGDRTVDGARIVARLAAVPPQVPLLVALRAALVPLVDDMQADRELWFLRMRVVHQNPALLPRLVTGGAENERAIAAAITARLGLAPEHGYPALVSAVVGAALRTCMGQWAAGGDARLLADLVDEAFAAVAAGLPEPATTAGRLPVPPALRSRDPARDPGPAPGVDRPGSLSRNQSEERR